MIRSCIAVLGLLGFGVLNPLHAQEGASKIVGLGEACDPDARIECQSGLECNASKPDVAGVCVSSSNRTMLGDDIPPRPAARAQ